MFRPLLIKVDRSVNSHLKSVSICRCFTSKKEIQNIGTWYGNQPSLSFHTTSSNSIFWEPDRKGGYDCEPKTKLTTVEHLRQGFKILKTEIKVWKNEVVEKIRSDPISRIIKGETDIVWLFDKPETLSTWVTSSDSDHNEGFSKCSFEMSKAGRGLFSGTLDTRIPKDGKITRAGYCTVRSQRAQKSFKRDSFYDWSIYNTLVLKVRGDGRSYLLNLSQEGPIDITWNDIYHYVLYTRGGPYWQIAKIPFSKFILGSKGKVQDKQSPIILDYITHFGISCGDKINGHFALEIEYIGLEYDPLHNEENPYEMYKTDPYIIGSTLVE